MHTCNGLQTGILVDCYRLCDDSHQLSQARVALDQKTVLQVTMPS